MILDCSSSRNEQLTGGTVWCKTKWMHWRSIHSRTI